MKIDLKKCTLSTAVLITIYAVFRLVRKCCWLAGAHIWLHHPIRSHVVGNGIEMLFYLCTAVFLLGGMDESPSTTYTYKTMEPYSEYSCVLISIYVNISDPVNMQLSNEHF